MLYDVLRLWLSLKRSSEIMEIISKMCLQLFFRDKTLSDFPEQRSGMEMLHNLEAFLTCELNSGLILLIFGRGTGNALVT